MSVNNLNKHTLSISFLDAIINWFSSTNVDDVAASDLKQVSIKTVSSRYSNFRLNTKVLKIIQIFLFSYIRHFRCDFISSSWRAPAPMPPNK